MIESALGLPLSQTKQDLHAADRGLWRGGRCWPLGGLQPVRPAIGEQPGLVIYTALPYNIRMEFIETSIFTKLVYTYLTDDEYFRNV